MIRYVEIKQKKIGFGQPKVCVPLVGRTDEEILSEVDRIVEFSKESEVDMVEFRGDFYEKLNDRVALRSLMTEMSKRLKDIIFLFTIRSEAEGGEKLSFAEPDIKTINKYVIENELSDIVDVELFNGDDNAKELIATAAEHGVKIIMSNHDFKSTPEDSVIVKRLCRMQELGADVVKIAVMPENKYQLLSLLKTITVMNEEYARVPVVAISMGKIGALSRITGELFGSAITFSSLDKGSAPGQIPVKDIRRILDDIGNYCV